MRTEYDFTKAKRNPYAKRLKKAVTIRLEPNVIDYFKTMSGETGIPYQNLIKLEPVPESAIFDRILKTVHLDN